MVSSAIVDKYIGESARLIREMFGYAKVRNRHMPASASVLASHVQFSMFFPISFPIMSTVAYWKSRQLKTFTTAQEHQPCIIFMDEIDAIGGRRFSEGTSADREIQRTLMELLSQLDGFDAIGKVKMIMATNR